MAFTKNLDDFEQLFNKFTIALEENIQSALSVLDKEEVPAPVADKLMNILIGMQEYLDARGSDLCDDLESHIANQYKWRGYVEISEDNTITLPQNILDTLGWKPGDLLSWSVLDDRSVQLRKLPLQQE